MYHLYRVRVPHWHELNGCILLVDDIVLARLVFYNDVHKVIAVREHCRICRIYLHEPLASRMIYSVIDEQLSV